MLYILTYFIFSYLCACRMCANDQGGQKGELNPLELELLVAVSHLKQVLGIQLESSKRATIALRP